MIQMLLQYLDIHAENSSVTNGYKSVLNQLVCMIGVWEPKKENCIGFRSSFNIIAMTF